MSAVDVGRWQTLTLSQQLGNVASEVSRFDAWASRADGQAQRDAAAQRALELIDLTIADARWRSRLRELTRLRELCSDVFTGTGMYTVDVAALEEYLLPFALRARQQR